MAIIHDIEVELDPIVERLVLAIEELPATWTFSSCGGHGEITNVSQE